MLYEMSPINPAHPFIARPTLTSDGCEVTYFDNAAECSVQVERPDGNFLCFIGERHAWQVVGLVVDLSAPYPEDDAPVPAGAVMVPCTEPLADLTIARVKLSLDDLTVLKLSGDYSRILQSVPMTPDELTLLRSHVAGLE